MTTLKLKRTADAEAYLEKHGLTETLSRAVDQVIKERPSDPFAAIARMLGGSGAETSKLPTRAAAREYADLHQLCLLYTSPSPRDGLLSRMPSSA